MPLTIFVVCEKIERTVFYITVLCEKLRLLRRVQGNYDTKQKTKVSMNVFLHEYYVLKWQPSAMLKLVLLSIFVSMWSMHNVCDGIRSTRTDRDRTASNLCHDIWLPFVTWDDPSGAIALRADCSVHSHVAYVH